MARAPKPAWAGLALLSIAAITVSALAVAGVFSSPRSQARSHVTPVPDVFGMTTAKAVRTLRAAHLRPAIQFTRHAKGQPSGIVVAALSGGHPISVGGGHSVGVASEGDAIPLIVSR
jgi:beta-lactam-binding protein with PASTA domain